MRVAPPFDLVTVAYAGEIKVLKLQARSISLYLPPQLLGRIFVVANDDEAFVTRFLETVAPLYGRYRDRLVILRSQEVDPSIPSWGHGWRKQQALKMAIASHIDRPAYLVLDTKNHFIRPVALRDILLDDSRVRTWPLSYVMNFESHCRGSFAYFGLDPEPLISRLPPSITPITLISSVVRDMVDEIRNRELKPFGEFFVMQSVLTEFLAYYAFLSLKAGNLENVFVYGEPTVATLFEDKVVDNNNFDSIMFQAALPSRFMFGIHHGALRHITREQAIRIADFWFARRLIDDPADAADYLQP